MRNKLHEDYQEYDILDSYDYFDALEYLDKTEIDQSYKRNPQPLGEHDYDD